jgi:putative transposase
MMDYDVEGLTGVGYSERSDGRINQRNGYREPPWHTTLGTLPVDHPEAEERQLFPVLS